ncbi:sensor histidine kinase [Nocardiopsis suaedae]|uniref:histidine kinase n=1 Tax=Nocardiopsis suaedae TaxID=3018444 RepID=A0ABT4TVQ2_9ACTN|nr:ATP-binding protein [Nocardiopsis suaedae]MDA2808781.1 histidine kinase [Nocardiopsis suaedae]
MSEREPIRGGSLSRFLTWAERYSGHGTDALLWAVLVGLFAAEVFGLRDRSTVLAETLMAALLFGAALALRRRFPVTALGLACLAPLVQAMATTVGVVDVFALAYVLPAPVLAFLAGRRSERTAPVVTLTVTLALVMLLFNALTWVRSGDLREALTGVTDWASGLLALVGAVVAPWLLGRYWRRVDDLRTVGWEIAERMELARDVDAERARLRERSRIATDMHGALGNDLALIGVRAAALEMTVHDDGAREAASELRVAAHAANLRLREIIGVLRAETGAPGTRALEAGATVGAPTPPEAGTSEPGTSEPGDGRSVQVPGDEAVAAAVDRAAGAGMEVALVREGTAPISTGSSGHVAHLVVQEALTNAARYAPGSRVAVRLLLEEGATSVRIVDTGGVVGGPGSRTKGNGSGLAELRGLVESAGGAFSAGRNDEGGFTVTARISDTHPDDTTDAPTVTATTAVTTEAEPAPGVRTERRERAERAGTETETASRMRRARDGARRWLIAAVVVPSVLAAVFTTLGFGALWTVGVNTVLPRSDYESMRVGDAEATVDAELPLFHYPPDDPTGGPPAPPGARCRYYLVEYENGLPPLYRLCFADGRLVAKDVVHRQE